jgi:integrase/recombinase XerD
MIKDVIMHYRHPGQGSRLVTPTTSSVVPDGSTELARKDRRFQVPAIVEAAGGNARFAYEEFFAGEENIHTERAYRHAVHRFLAHCEELAVPLQQVTPGIVSDYLKNLQAEVKTRSGEPPQLKPASKPTKKLHLAGIRKLFDKAVERHAVVLNPAASVRSPRHSVIHGKTQPFDQQQIHALLASFDTSDVVGLRDRAIIATLYFTAARVGAVSKLTRKDFYTDGRQFYFHYDEKGGKQRDIPARLDLQEYVEQYVEAAGAGDAGTPLFLSAVRRTKKLSSKGMTPNDMLRMVKRRLRDGGISARFVCHSFRATTATLLIEQGVPIDQVQELLGHADTRTTQLYNHTQKRVTRNIVERIPR